MFNAARTLTVFAIAAGAVFTLAGCNNRDDDDDDRHQVGEMRPYDEPKSKLAAKPIERPAYRPELRRIEATQGVTQVAPRHHSVGEANVFE